MLSVLHELLAQISKQELVTSAAFQLAENQFFIELIEGLVHQYPLCCVLEYCSDIYYRPDPKPANERGVVFFRTFSLHRSESLFNGIDSIGVSDHFVPCNKCKSKKFTPRIH